MPLAKRRQWVYVDESIHDALGFIVTTFVFSNSNLSEPVAAALGEAGVVPGRDEFKSSVRMANSPQMRDLRDLVLAIATSSTKIAVLVTPARRRKVLGCDVLSTLATIIETNKVQADDVEVYFDQGLISPSNETPEIVDRLQANRRCELVADQDSRVVFGLQAADVVAHSVAQVLREELGNLRKNVPLGPEQGYDEGTDASLGWTLRMTLRRNFFVGPVVVEKGQDPVDALNAELLGWGVFVSDGVADGVRTAVQRVFGTLWLGCIH